MVLCKEWNQGRGKSATEQQFIHDVRRVVADVEGVSECSLTDDRGKQHHPSEAGDARCQRAESDANVARHQRAISH